MSSETLYFRDGREFTGIVLKNEKGKPYTSWFSPCSRCGGQGVSEAWRYTGYTCYRCNGKNSRTFEYSGEVKL
jgi:DnaJ-class molecular chaperone